MPVTVYDKDNKPITISEDEAAKGVLSGEYGFNAETVFPVRYNGQLGTVHASALQQALSSGAELSTHEELESARTPQPKTLAQQAKETAKDALDLAVNPGRTAAGLVGVARGATMGASDADALDLGYAVGGEKGREAVRSQLDTLKNEHPYFSAGGEVEGAIIPSVLSGGAAAPRALKAAAPLLERAAPRAIEAIAEEAPSVAKALPAPIEAAAPNALESTNAQGFALRNQAAERIAKVAPGATPIEPTVHPGEIVTSAPAEVATVETVGKEVLADTGIGKAAGIQASPRAAQAGNALPAQLVTDVGDLVERGVMKALGGEGKTLLAKMGKGALATGARGAVEGAIIGGADELNEDRLGDHTVNGEKLLAAVGFGALFGAATGGVIGGAGPLVRRVGTELATKAGGLAGEQAFRALNPRAANVRAADRVPGGARAVGEYLLEEKLIQAGDRVEDIAPRINTARETKGKEIAAIIDAAGKAGIEGPSLDRIVKGIDEGALERLRAMPNMNRGSIARVDAIIEDLRAASEDGKLSVSKAHELRGQLDDVIRWNTNPMQPINETTEALKGVRKALNEATEEALASGGGRFGDEYKKAKGEYQKLSVALNAAEDAVQRAPSHRAVSVSDYLIGAAHLAGGHPLAGFAASLAHKIVRERGNSTAAVILDKLSSLEIIRNATRRLDRDVTRGVGRAFGESYAPVRTKEKLYAGRESNGDRIEAVMRTATEGHGENIGRTIAPLAAHAPKTSGAFAQAAIRAATYLRSLLPHGDEKTQNALQPHLHNAADDMSETDKGRFERAFHVVNDPMSIMLRLEDGTIAPDEVEALRATHPALYEQIKEEIARKLAATKTPITRELRLSIATFLEDPSFAGPTYAPDYIAAAQEQYAAQPPPPNGAPKKGRGKAPKGVDLKGLGGLHSLSGLSKELDRDFKL